MTKCGNVVYGEKKSLHGPIAAGVVAIPLQLPGGPKEVAWVTRNCSIGLLSLQADRTKSHSCYKIESSLTGRSTKKMIYLRFVFRFWTKCILLFHKIIYPLGLLYTHKTTLPTCEKPCSSFEQEQATAE